MTGDLDFDLLYQPEAEELQELEVPAGELHLRFQLTSGTELAFAAAGIAEVMSVSAEQITPMPNVSPLILGALNFRGKVIWVADLGQFLGDSQPLKSDRNDLPILAITDGQDTILAVAVNTIVGMEWLEKDALKSSDQCPEEMAPFVQGEWLFPESEHPLRLLDPGAVIRSSRWVT